MDDLDVDVLELVERLRRYGTARDRATERQPRWVSITDDEAIFLWEVMLEGIGMLKGIERIVNDE